MSVEHWPDLVLELLVCEAVRVDAVVAAVGGERIVIDIRAAEGRVVLDVYVAAVVVLRGYRIDVLVAAAVIGDVREKPVDQGLVARVERERRRAFGSDGL